MDESTIKFCLDSIMDYVDEIIFVHCTFSDYNQFNLNPDGTLEIAEAYGARIIQGVFQTEIEARNQFFKSPLIRYGDQMLIIDADERLKNAFYLDQDFSDSIIYNVYLFMENIGYADVINLEQQFNFDAWFFLWKIAPRIVTKVPGLKYHGRHWTILDKNLDDIMNTNIVFNYPNSNVIIEHLNILRPFKRLQIKSKYHRGSQFQERTGRVGTPLYPEKNVDCRTICKSLRLNEMCINYYPGIKDDCLYYGKKKDIC